jgi:hypothetical protein
LSISCQSSLVLNLTSNLPERYTRMKYWPMWKKKLRDWSKQISFGHADMRSGSLTLSLFTRITGKWTYWTYKMRACCFEEGMLVC